MTAATKVTEYGPWNPGLKSRLPSAFLPLSTMFRPENVFTGVAEARELAGFTGLEPEELVTFRPERLVVHELLIRVTADFSVPDGPRYEDLGINFRRITANILNAYIAPHMDEIVRAYEDLRARVRRLIDAELAAGLFAPEPAPPEARAAANGGLLARLGLGRRKAAAGVARESLEERERRVLAQWRRKAETADDALERCALRHLIRIVNAVRSRHGRVRGDAALLGAVVADMVCNEHGSEMIGRMIEPDIIEAARREGYRLLPRQERPVVMNIKGASASGKSTMRPLQRKLAEALGIRWADFAVISPDIWRKYLLDYGTLGPAYRYAGTLTGHEVRIIDQKLDRYMASKAERGRMSHLLIDRFRFDSFTPESDAEEGSTLLTRFGAVIYMFFMITPPDATVERSWKRGLEFGRFKAVDDLLDHNVEAYTGMPRLFFTWALRADKSVHYEFLDNSVPEGRRPLTVAFGWNGEMNILDIKCMLDVERYTKINVAARAPDEVYPDAATMAPENNTAFLAQCARTLPAINFADQASGRIYARLEQGRMVWTDAAAFARAIEDADTRAGLAALAPEAVADCLAGRLTPADAPRLIERATARTLGRWGGR